MRVARHLHLMGATGAIRTTSFHGREHLVVPVVALVEGVIFPVNADTPELVLASEFSTAPQGWNGRPVVAGHPVANGTQVSANSPTVLEERSFGTIFNTRIDGKRLLMEAWLDPQKAKKVGRDAERVIERALAGEPVEVSVGVFVLAESKNGSYGEKSYKAVWHEITPDHLAMLPEGVLGACSNTMGCGVRAAQVHFVTASGIEAKSMEKPTLVERLRALLPSFTEAAEAIEAELEVAGGPGSGNFGHSGRPGEVGGSSSGDGGLKEDGSFDGAAYVASKTLFDGVKPRSSDPLFTMVDKQASEDFKFVARKAGKTAKFESISGGDLYHPVLQGTIDVPVEKFKLGLMTGGWKKQQDGEHKVSYNRIHKGAVHRLSFQRDGDQTLVEFKPDYKKRDFIEGGYRNPYVPKGMELKDLEATVEANLEDLAGKRHSSSDEELIQAMHDKSVDLGAYCAKEPAFADRFVKTMEAADGFRTALAALDPTVLEGADKEEHPFTYCREVIIPAIVEKGQAVDDPDAFCGWWKAERNASEHAVLKAAEHKCSCGGQKPAEGDDEMAKTKAERIKALIANPKTLFTADDAKALEVLTDERLEAIEVQADKLVAEAAEAKAAADKTAAEVKAAADKATAEKLVADEAAKLVVAAAAKPKTADEWLAEAPEPIRRMVTRAAAQEAAQKTELVAALKAAQTEYTEDELNGMALDQLQRFSRVAKLAQPAVDFGGRAPRAAADDASVIPPPPDMNAMVRAAQKKGELIN